MAHGDVLGTARGKAVRVELVGAAAVRADAKAGGVGVCNQQHDRALGPAPVTNANGAGSHPPGIKVQRHGYLV